MCVKNFCKFNHPFYKNLLLIFVLNQIMQQLGYSLDAVNLKDVFEDDDSVHLVMEVRRGSNNVAASCA